MNFMTMKSEKELEVIEYSEYFYRKKTEKQTGCSRW